MCDCNILGIQDFPFDCHAVSYHDMCSIYLIQHAQRRIMGYAWGKEVIKLQCFRRLDLLMCQDHHQILMPLLAKSRQISEQFTSDYIVPVLASRLIKRESKMSKSVIRSPFCSRNYWQHWGNYPLSLDNHYAISIQIVLNLLNFTPYEERSALKFQRKL